MNMLILIYLYFNLWKLLLVFFFSCKIWWQNLLWIFIAGTFWGALKDEIEGAGPPTGFQGNFTCINIFYFLFNIIANILKIKRRLIGKISESWFSWLNLNQTKDFCHRECNATATETISFIFHLSQINIFHVVQFP